MTNRFAFYFDAAQDAFNAGFASKAAQQRCLSDLNRAYEQLRNALHSAVCNAAPALSDNANPTQEEWDARVAHFNANEVPFDLHQVRDRHVALFAQWTANDALVRDLINLRAEAKAAAIQPVAKVNIVTETEKKVRETLKEMIERKTAQFHEGVRLVEIFGRLPVSVTPHWVVNDKGTGFIRCFYYLNGKLTALNVILAVLEATADEA